MPYWLTSEGDLGNYNVQNEALKGLPETPNPILIEFHLSINGRRVSFEVPLTYRTTDRVAGEVVQNFQVVPRATTQLSEEVLLFQNQNPKKYFFRFKPMWKILKVKWNFSLPKIGR